MLKPATAITAIALEIPGKFWIFFVRNCPKWALYGEAERFSAQLPEVPRFFQGNDSLTIVQNLNARSRALVFCTNQISGVSMTFPIVPVPLVIDLGSSLYKIVHMNCSGNPEAFAVIPGIAQGVTEAQIKAQMEEYTADPCRSAWVQLNGINYAI